MIASRLGPARLDVDEGEGTTVDFESGAMGRPVAVLGSATRNSESVVEE